MKLIFVGRTDEVAGFALAGAQTVTCDAPENAASTVEHVSAEGGDVGLVLVSPWIARHAARAIDAVQQRKGPPVISIVPELGD